ncbi:MAG: hypothetical protein ACPG6V_07590, partial [Flavobacteriales bacterium]
MKAKQIQILKYIFFLSLLSFSNLTFGQIGVGTTNPNQSSILDIFSDSKGVLIPRVELQSTTDQTTIVSPEPSLLVFNTGNGGLTEIGYFYWDSSKWVKLVTSDQVSGTDTDPDPTNELIGSLNITNDTLFIVENGITHKVGLNDYLDQNATEVSFDNSGNSLGSDNVQDAVVELLTGIDSINTHTNNNISDISA